MRLLHTADWHLGHHLHGHDRSHEQGCFLDWLMDLIQTPVDGLLIAGDIFDTANPSNAAGGECSTAFWPAYAAFITPEPDCHCR